jgi:hypothetical protein
MPSAVLALAVLTCAPTVPAQALTAVSRPALRHNPFNRPVSPQVVPVAAGNTGLNAAAVAADAEPALEWNPRLRAVVVAGARSMALVDGDLVELGGSVEGYRLQAVDEDRAVFVKGRERITLVMGDRSGPKKGND